MCEIKLFFSTASNEIHLTNKRKTISIGDLDEIKGVSILLRVAKNYQTKYIQMYICTINISRLLTNSTKILN